MRDNATKVLGYVENQKYKVIAQIGAWDKKVKGENNDRRKTEQMENREIK